MDGSETVGRGVAEFRDPATGDVVFNMLSPIATDGDGHRTPVTLSWSRADHRVVVGKRVPLSFLQKAAWPVHADAAFLGSGQTEGFGTNYTTVRSATTASVPSGIWIGQERWFSYYWINRGHFGFDITSIPDNATILSADLELTLNAAYGSAFTIAIQEWTDPADGIAGDDYSALTLNNPTVFGSVSTSGLAGSFLVPINGAINQPGGVSAVGEQCALTGRSDRDNAAIAPSAQEYVIVSSPTLWVGYTVGPAAPTGFGAAGRTTSTIDWQWTDNSSSEDGFTLHDGGGVEVTTFPAAPGSGSVVTGTEAGLSENTLYTRHIHAVEGGQSSDPSNTTSAYTAVHDPSECDFQVVWDGTRMMILVVPPPNAAAGQTGVQVTRRDGTVIQAFTPNYEIEDPSPPTTATWYQIQFRNGDGVATALSPKIDHNGGPVSEAPDTVTAMPVFGGVEVNWDSVPGVHGYVVYRSGDPAGPFESRTITGSLTTSWTDTQLTADTDYWYTVTSYTGAIESEFAPAVRVRTGPPTLVAGIEAEGVAGTSMPYTVVGEYTNFIGPIEGTWDSVYYFFAGDNTQLNTTGAGWTPGALEGFWIRPNANSTRAWKIISNSANQMYVAGDCSPYVAAGDQYQFVAKLTLTDPGSGKELRVNEMWVPSPTLILADLTLEEEVWGGPAPPGLRTVKTETPYVVGGLATEILTLAGGFNVVGGLAQPPTLSITSPTPNQNVTGSSFTVGLQVSSDRDEDEVFVAADNIEIDDGVNSPVMPGSDISEYLAFVFGPTSASGTATTAHCQIPGTDTPYSGPVTLRVSIRDVEGNVSAVASVTFFINGNNTGSVASVSPSVIRRNTTNVPVTVTFNGTPITGVGLGVSAPASTGLTFSGVNAPSSSQVTFNVTSTLATEIRQHVLQIVDNGIVYDVLVAFRYEADGSGHDARGPQVALSLDDPTIQPQEPVNGGAMGAVGVWLHNGVLETSAVDMAIRAGKGFDFSFIRTYKSNLDYHGPLGHNWDFNYNKRLEFVAGGSNAIRYYNGAGRVDDYADAGSGNYFAAGFYRRFEVYTAWPAGGKVTGAAQVGNVVICTDRHRNRMVFTPLEADLFGTGNLGARLDQIIDRNGNVLRCLYNEIGQLVGVIDTHGRGIRFVYDDDGYLYEIRDFSPGYDGEGRSVRFTVDASGNLVKVEQPETDQFNGATRIGHEYRYDNFDAANPSRIGSLASNHYLVRQIDAKGQAYFDSWFDASGANSVPRVVKQEYGGSNRFIYLNYQVNGPNGVGTEVVNRLGHKSRVVFNVDHTVKRQVTYSRTWSSDGQTAIGPKVRDGSGDETEDPDSWVVTYENYTANFEATKITSPTGTVVELTYDVANLNPLSRGNVLEVLQTPDPVRGGSPIKTTATYHSVFNFVETSVDPRAYDPNDPLWGGSPPAEAVRVAALTATRTYHYNTGNLLRVDLPPATLNNGNKQTITLHTAWDDYGNVVAITDGEGSVTRIERYENGPQQHYVKQVTVDHGGRNLITSYTWDERGNLRSSTSPRGLTTSHEVNELDQVEVVTTPTLTSTNGGTYYSVVIRDANHNVTHSYFSAVDANGDGPTPPATLDPANFAAADWHQSETTYDILDLPLTTKQLVSVNGAPHYRTVRTTYDAGDRVMRVESAEAVSGNEPGNHVTFYYDELDRPFRTVRAEGTVDEAHSEVDYNADSAPVETRLYRNKVYSISTYDWPQDTNGPTVTPGVDDFIVSFTEYDGHNRPIRQIDGAGHYREVTLDAGGRVIGSAACDNTNQLLAFGIVYYDELGRPYRSETGAFKRSFSYTFTPGQNPATVVVPANDAIDTNGDGKSESETTYNRQSLPTELTDDLGRITSIEWDTSRRKTRVLAPQVTGEPQRNASYFYYEDGLLKRTTTDMVGTDGSITRLSSSVEHDELDRPYCITDAKGAVTRIEYSSIGAVKTIDPLGNAIGQAYDMAGRPIRTIYFGAGQNGTDITTQQTFDDNDRVQARIDDESYTEAYVYNLRNELVRLNKEDGTFELYERDGLGNVCQFTDGSGNVEVREYDERNLLVTSITTANPAADFEFKRDGVVSHQYDGLARPASTTKFHKDGPNVNGTFTQQRAYNSFSQPEWSSEQVGPFTSNPPVSTTPMISERMFNGVGANCCSILHDYLGNPLVSSAVFDELDRVKSVNDFLVGGLPWEQDYRAGAAADSRFPGSTLETEIEFDALNRQVARRTVNPTGAGGFTPGTRYIGMRLAFDEVDQIIACNHEHYADTGEYFKYDRRGLYSLGEVRYGVPDADTFTRINGPGAADTNLVVQYDIADGNDWNEMVELEPDASSLLYRNIHDHDGDGTNHSGHGGVHELTSVNDNVGGPKGKVFCYDDNGNMRGDHHHLIVYSVTNQPVEIWEDVDGDCDLNPAIDKLLVTYWYDHRGLCVSVRFNGVAGPYDIAGVHRFYGTSGGASRPLEQRQVFESPSGASEDYYAPARSVTPCIDQFGSTQFPGDPTGTVYWPLIDYKGSVLAIVNSGTNKVEECYRYTAYAETLIEKVKEAGNWSVNDGRVFSDGGTPGDPTDDTTTFTSAVFNVTADWAGKLIRLDTGQNTEAAILSANPAGDTFTVRGNIPSPAVDSYWQTSGNIAYDITNVVVTGSNDTPEQDTTITLAIEPTLDDQQTPAEDGDLIGMYIEPRIGSLIQAQIVDNNRAAKTITIRGNWSNLISTSDYLKLYLRESCIGNKALYAGKWGYSWEGGWVTTDPGTPSETTRRLFNHYAVNHRNLAPDLGRWIQADPIGAHGDRANIGNRNTYCANNPINGLDPTGLAIVTDNSLDKYFSDKGYSFEKTTEGGKYVYTKLTRNQQPDTESEADKLEHEILVGLAASRRNFRIRGNRDEKHGSRLVEEISLESHIRARRYTVEYFKALKAKFSGVFTPNTDLWKTDDDTVAPKEDVGWYEAVSDIWGENADRYKMGCANAVRFSIMMALYRTMLSVAFDGDEPSARKWFNGWFAGAQRNPITKDRRYIKENNFSSGDAGDWVPGDWGYVNNTEEAEGGTAGENILFVGGSGGARFGGLLGGGVQYKPLTGTGSWQQQVEGWHPDPDTGVVEGTRRFTAVGLE